MAMTRKHYAQFAQIIKDEQEALEVLDPNMASVAKASTFIMANKMATIFAQDNPRFDRDKFFKACGYDR